MNTRLKQLALTIGMSAVVAIGFMSLGGQAPADGGVDAGSGSCSCSCAVTADPPLAGSGTGSDHLRVTACAAGEHYAQEGSAWMCLQNNDYRGRNLDLVDEFLESSCSSGAPCGSIWSLVASGTGAGTNITSDTLRLGVRSLQTGTTATGRAGIFTSSGAIDFGSYDSLTFSATVGWPTLSNATNGHGSVVGFADVNSAIDQTDGCYFLLDERAVARAPATGSKPPQGTSELACVCASNGVDTEFPMDGTTTDDSGAHTVSQPIGALVLPNTNMHDLEIDMVISNGIPQEADFLVDGVKSCVIKSHIPSGSLRVTGLAVDDLKNVGTTNAAIYVDRTEFKPHASVARQLVKNLVWWGDSLTAGKNACEACDPVTRLAALADLTPQNRGVGGDTAAMIDTRFNAEPKLWGYPTVIWAGRNNYTDVTGTEAAIADMVGKVTTSHYIVLSVTNGTGEPAGTGVYNTIIGINNDLSAAYGSHYLDVRSYLVSLYDPGNPQDVIDHGNDEPPSSLRSDAIHLNAAGYLAVASFVYAHMAILTP